MLKDIERESCNISWTRLSTKKLTSKSLQVFKLLQAWFDLNRDRQHNWVSNWGRNRTGCSEVAGGAYRKLHGYTTASDLPSSHYKSTRSDYSNKTQNAVPNIVIWTWQFSLGLLHFLLKTTLYKWQSPLLHGNVEHIWYTPTVPTAHVRTKKRPLVRRTLQDKTSREKVLCADTNIGLTENWIYQITMLMKKPISKLSNFWVAHVQTNPKDIYPHLNLWNWSDSWCNPSRSSTTGHDGPHHQALANQLMFLLDETFDVTLIRTLYLTFNLWTNILTFDVTFYLAIWHFKWQSSWHSSGILFVILSHIFFWRSIQCSCPASPREPQRPR